jgi:hypothetical protein
MNTPAPAKTLQGQNRILRIGPDKGGRWEVVP